MRNLVMPLVPRIACLVCFSGLLYTDDADRTDPHQRCAGHDVLIVGKTPETLQASFNSGWSMSTWTRFYRCLHARTGLTEQTDGCLFACGRPGPAVDTFKQPGSTALFSCLCYLGIRFTTRLEKVSLQESGVPTAVAILGASISTCSVAVPARRSPTS
jgi:hypothetical protein